MIKIMMTVRNRLSITKKAISALFLHTKTPYQLYIYDNLTDFRLDDHFNYFYKLYNRGEITQVTFNTADSTFKAFSKASACNAFGAQHEQDPEKDNYDFLLFLDNDIIVTPEWDLRILKAWRQVKKFGLKNIKAISQRPGGIKEVIEYDKPIAGTKAIIGKLGGSGFWSVKPDFFRDVGFLDLKKLIGRNKMHDQLYWRMMDISTQGKKYIMGLGCKLAIHCGHVSGSICNILDKRPDALYKIKFEEAEINIDKMSFEEFYNSIVNNKFLIKDW